MWVGWSLRGVLVFVLRKSALAFVDHFGVDRIDLDFIVLKLNSSFWQKKAAFGPL